MLKLDAIGKQCPIPVIMSKKEVAKGTKVFEISVENEYAVENLKNYAESADYKTTVNEENGNYFILFEALGETCSACEEYGKEMAKQPKNWAVFVGKDTIGDGDKELGTNLIRMFFFTLTQDDDIPKYIMFMNGGVFLPANDEQILEHLKVLEEKGTQILICGTCLNFFHIEKVPTVGKVSNMFDIVEKMKAADKVISL